MPTAKKERWIFRISPAGVYSRWRDEQKWTNVRIAEDGAIRWSEEVELCPGATYLKLTGKSPEEVVPSFPTVVGMERRAGGTSVCCRTGSFESTADDTCGSSRDLGELFSYRARGRMAEWRSLDTPTRTPAACNPGPGIAYVE
jgi:hypothetical protein